MRISRLTSFLFTVFLISLFVLPQNATAQYDLAEADTVRFTLPKDSQFLPGEAGIPDQLKTLLDSVDIDRRSFNRLLVVGTYDEMGWKPSACDVPGNIPLEKESYKARQNQCDAEVAKWRAIQSAQYMIDQRWVNAWKVQPRLLLDERERGIVLIFVDDRTEERITALENRMEQLDRGNLDDIGSRLKKLKKWFNQLEQRVADNDSDIDDLKETNDRQNEEIAEVRTTANEALQTAEKARKQDGSSFSALSVGYRNELGLHMGEIVFETGDPFSVRFSLGGHPGGINTDLCKDSVGVSKALFAEVGGAYTFRTTDRFSIGIGASATTTLFSLEDEDKGLFVFSAGPDVFARFEVVDHVHLHGGAGLNGRYFMEDGVELSGNADQFGTEFKVGVTISF